MQDYQVPALQQQLRTIKDLKRQYKAAYSSFVNHLPDVAQLRENDPCSTAPNDGLTFRGVGAPSPGTVETATQPAAAQSASSEACDASRDILMSMRHQVDNLGSTAAMEQTAAFVLAAELDRHDACAVLTGTKSRYYFHQSTVSVGRTSVYKGKVDIDLNLEGAGTNISRYTCFIDLDLSYGFLLHNIGKHVIRVNNIVVPIGHKIKLPHLSLLEVGGITLLFQVNAEAIVRLCLKPPPCPA